MLKVIVATVLCDFKLYSAQQVIERLLELDHPDDVEPLVYANIETIPGNVIELAGYEFITENQAVHYDAWSWESAWRGGRKGDQDQRYRLPGIVIARNMAREFAMARNADAILYVDSDVLIPRNSLVELLKENLNIVGGLAPGRGAHSHVYYTGSGRHLKQIRENLLRTDYGTAGFVLIRRDVYQRIAWRWGWSIRNDTGPHSEDPLYGEDARVAGLGWWHIRTDLVAEHLDNPNHPLSDKEAAKF